LGFSGAILAADEEQDRGRELIVTATKRAENIQDIPLAVQSLWSDVLDSEDINSFTDYIEKLPNTSFAGRGPGQNDVYIRGVSTSKGSLFQSGGIGAGPTVAMYFDEAPLTASGRNIDVFITDMERIEVLPGPQGTLYGASSQAGTVRMITKKPDLSNIEAGIELMYGATKKGDNSSGFEGFINLPIVEDKFGVRIALYDVTHGGYIDNVQGTISFAESNRIVNIDATDIYAVADNSALVEDDFNETNYRGGRITADWEINDDWNARLGFMSQTLEADGVFDYSPDVGDLKVQRFSPDKLKDEFEQYNWTIEGRIGELEVVYAGSYLERDVDQRIDYVGYTLGGGFQPFYNCTYSAADFGTLEYDINECAAPSQKYHGIQHSEDSQHELRFSGDINDSVRFVAGVYFDDSKGGVSQEWEYHSPEALPGGVAGIPFAPNGPHSEANAYFNPNTRDPEVAFFNDLIPKSSQIAYFGELTFDFAEDWSTTIGLRHYDIDLEVNGSFNFAPYGAVDNDSGGTLNDVEPVNSKDTIGKVTLKNKFNENVLFYGTYSQGFRRGGFNRQGDVIHRTTGEFVYPAFFDSDTIDSYEFGWKSTMADGDLRFNGAIYFIDWSDIQIDIFDQQINQLLFTANAAEAEIFGIESDFVYYVDENWTLTGALSFNDTELTDRPVGADNLLPVGSDLALTPTFQGNVTARYEFEVSGGYDFYTQLAFQYRGDTHTSVVVGDDFPLDSYTVADLSFGLAKDDWSVKLFVNNLTDERAQQFISDQDDIARTVVNRPLNVNLKVSYIFQ